MEGRKEAVGNAPECTQVLEQAKCFLLVTFLPFLEKN